MEVREGITEAVTFEQGPGGGEGASHVGLWEIVFHVEGTASANARVCHQLLSWAGGESPYKVEALHFKTSSLSDSQRGVCWVHVLPDTFLLLKLTHVYITRCRFSVFNKIASCSVYYSSTSFNIFVTIASVDIFTP